MLFGNCNKNTHVQIQVDERVRENQFLGEIINDKLNWKSCIKLSRSKTKHILDHKSIHILRCSNKSCTKQKKNLLPGNIQRCFFTMLLFTFIWAVTQFKKQTQGFHEVQGGRRGLTDRWGFYYIYVYISII